MDQWIEKILDTDRKAGEQMADALRRQVETGAIIQEKKRKLHDEYIDRAQKRLHILEEKEAEIVDESLEEFLSSSRRQTQRLEELYRKHKEEWIAAVTERALGEDAPC